MLRKTELLTLKQKAAISADFVTAKLTLQLSTLQVQTCQIM